MTYDALQRFRRRLIDQRSVLLKRWRQTLSDESEWFAAYGPDWRDVAVAAPGATVFPSIDGYERGALARIQSSLARIERGTYDECVACHGKIAEERLRAFPDTDRCGRCAPRLN